ncbi:MAG: AmmeMemoRadiSam system radical SAM enzyme [Bacillota bacterium]
MQKARYFEKTEGSHVKCLLCPHACRLGTGETGKCRVRTNLDGSLLTANYGLVTAIAMDPIEKKPLYHFFPGKEILSVGTFGCNLRCPFCQNWSIAHGTPPGRKITAEYLVSAAQAAQEDGSCVGIAYTYSEPLVWYEFVKDTAVLAAAKGLKNVLVTNGMIQPAPLIELLENIDAMNIDIKGFAAQFYKKHLGGSLKTVLNTAKTASQGGCHVEITTLIVPGLNDRKEDIRGLTGWIADNLGPDVPLHLSRYFPNYQMTADPTPLKVMEMARDLALEKLNYVYLGNTHLPGARNTYCPSCKAKLIDRQGYRVVLAGLEGRTCRRCGYQMVLFQ